MTKHLSSTINTIICIESSAVITKHLAVTKQFYLFSALFRVVIGSRENIETDVNMFQSQVETGTKPVLNNDFKPGRN